MLSTRKDYRRLQAIRSHLSAVSHVTTRDTVSSSSAQSVLDTRTSVPVLDSHISYLDTGPKGKYAAIFLHGNPTAAFLWRNVIPHVRTAARCVAPDLIGMGHSGKPNIQYRYKDHYRYFSTWMNKMNFQEKLVIVCHDWGAGLGLHWANQNRDRIQGVVHMEGLVAPVLSWETFPEVARGDFQALRTDAGEDMVMKDNFFVERWLPNNVLRQLTAAEMEEYRAPYSSDMRHRLPTLTWPREIPIAENGEGPDDVLNIAVDIYTWLSQSEDLPKMYIHANPGMFSARLLEGVGNWPNQKIVEVRGLHYLQEDSPDDIGQAIHSFVENL